jgi:hypothetical protein
MLNYVFCFVASYYKFKLFKTLNDKKKMFIKNYVLK